jgi:hypothetical protein
MELHAYRMQRREMFVCRHHIVDAFFSALTISTITTPGVIINATVFRRNFLLELRTCCSCWSYAHAAFDGSRRCTGTELGKAGGSSACGRDSDRAD